MLEVSERTRKLLICAFLGFSSGLPLFFFLNLIPIWLRSDINIIQPAYYFFNLSSVFNNLPFLKSELFKFIYSYGQLGPYYVTSPIDLKTIGLFNLLQLPYTLKFLWAPFLDRYAPLSIGRRRSWILLTQIGLLLVMVCYAWANPSHQMMMVIIITFLLTFFSATQDIAIDAYRREILSDEELGLGNSIGVTAYRLAVIVPGSLSLVLSDYISWPWVFMITALFMIPGMIVILMSREPIVPPAELRSVREMIVIPLAEYWHRKGVQGFVLVIAFFILYKLGDSMAVALSSVFYYDIGFSRTDIGTIAKYSQLIASIGGGILGGVLMLKIGINKGLWLFGLVQMTCILGFAWLASFGKFADITSLERFYLALVIAYEYLGVGLGTAAFVAFMARESNPIYAATQLALLTALSSVPRTFVNGISGKLIEVFGYYDYFWLCFFLSIPGMLLLFKVAPWNEKKAVQI